MKYKSSVPSPSKATTNVNVFVDKQTDKWTGRKLNAPDLSMRGIKKKMKKKNKKKKKKKVYQELLTNTEHQDKNAVKHSSQISHVRINKRGIFISL